jgi:hypothetical protein
MRPAIDHAICIDLETLMAGGYSLEKLKSPRAYILDPRFDVLCLGLAVGSGPISIFHKFGPPGGAIADGVERIRSELAIGKLLVCHNAGFDALILKLRYTIQATRIFDTKDYAASLGLGASLGNLARHLGLRKLEAPPFDETSLRDPIQRGQLARYNAMDVIITRSALKAAINDPNFPDEEFAIIDNTARQNIAGLRIDSPRVPEVSSLVGQARAVILNRLADTTPFDISKMNNLKDVGDYLESTYGARPASLCKDGDELPNFVRQHPAARQFISDWQMARSLGRTAKLIESYEALNGRVYLPLRYHAAHTGRFAGGGDACENFNIQSLPKAKRAPHAAIGLIRTLIIPEDGEYFVAADLSAIEARVIATLAGEESMLQRFRSGDDIYIWLANQIFPGVPVIKDGLNDYLRKLCKEAVLGIGFGMGFETFERKVLRVAPETRHEDIRRVFDSFKSMFPRNRPAPDVWRG